MINIEGLSKSFGKIKVLDDIDIRMKKGDVLGIIGSSGTGKSTLLRCLNLLEKPEKGIIEVGDIRLNTEKYTNQEAILLRQNTAMVFQNFGLFRRKTALQNVIEGLVIVKNMDKDKAEEIAVRELDKVGMLDRKDHYPTQLSGGQQQRVAIARALAMSPKVLLFDEPTSALDPELVGEVLDTINKTASEGNTMMIVSHEMNFIRKVSNRIIMLDNGKIIEDGSPDEVFGNPKSERAKDFFMRFRNE